MRYFRVLAVVIVMAAVGLTAVALARGSQAAPSTKLHRALQQVAQQFLRAQRHAIPQLPNVVPRRLRPALPGGATCFVATQCSIRPCLVPVANSVGPVQVLPNGATSCPLANPVIKSIRIKFHLTEVR